MCVPSSSSRSGLTLTIPNDSNSDHVGLIHNTSIGDSETVSKFSAFVNSTGGLLSARIGIRFWVAYFGIDVGRETSWHTECVDEGLDTFL